MSFPHDAAANEQAILTVAKLAAARDVASAVLEGRFAATAALLHALARLVEASARHAEHAA